MRGNSTDGVEMARKAAARTLRASAGIVVSCASILFMGCALIDLHSFTVSTFPAASEAILDEAPCVWIQFPEPVDQGTAESILSVTAEGRTVEGDLDWDANRLTFTPVEPFARGARHILRLDGMVRTAAGLLFNELIVVSFYVGTDARPPIVIQAMPVEGSVVAVTDPLHITFSRAMNSGSFTDAFSLSPTTKHRVSWNADGTIVTILPAERWSAGGLTTWSLTVACRSTDTIAMARTWTGTFLAQEEATSPTVVATRPASVTGATVLPLPGGLSDLVYGDSLHITFSEDVDIGSLNEALSLSPTLEGTIRSVSSGVFVFVPSEGWAMEQEYVLEISTKLADAWGNSMRAPYREAFAPAIPIQSVTGIILTGDLMDTPSYDSSGLNNATPHVLNWVASSSVPDNSLVLSVTIRFARGYDEEHRPVMADAVALEGFYPAVINPKVTQVNWMDSRTLCISCTGFSRSTDSPSLERLYYKLTISSGADQTMNQEGSYLEDDVTLLLESGSDA